MFARPLSRSRLTATTTLVASLATALLVGAAQADSELEPCADADVLIHAVQRLNDLRRHGDAPCALADVVMHSLAWDARLAGSAQQQARDLALRDLLSHVDAQQRGLGMRLRQAGYAAANAGENLAAGQNDFDDTLQAWLASPSHCANLMQPDFRDVGLACVQRHGSRHERFWVAHLGAPQRPAPISLSAREAAVAAAR